jgi:hypothetical protein
MENLPERRIRRQYKEFGTIDTDAVEQQATPGPHVTTGSVAFAFGIAQPRRPVPALNPAPHPEPCGAP